jgi:RimJ/RimL family protein N-acetyltransferase
MSLESQPHNQLQSTFTNNAGRIAAHFPVTIETPRLILREHEPADVDRILEISRAPDFFYYCFDGTREKAEDFIREALRTQEADPATGMRENHMMAVVLKETGKVIGHACIQRADYVPGIDYEPNYFIDPAEQGKGYGPEALCNMIDFAFTALGQTALTSTQHPGNLKAIALAEKLYGFRNIGEVQIDTVAGRQPRLLSQTTAGDFYALRAHDKRPMFLHSPPAPSTAPRQEPA